MVRPQTQEIADEFRTAIEAGEYPAGSLLPRAVDAATTYNVSKGIILGVYARLREEGLVQTVRRRGTVVLDRNRERITRSTLVYRDDRGYNVGRVSQSWQLLKHYGVQTAAAPAEIGALLKLEPQAKVVVRDRLLGLPGGRGKPDPIQLATSYIPGWLVAELPVLAETDTGPGGALDRIEETLGGPLSWVELLGAEPAGRTDAERLALTPGASLLRIYSVSSHPDGRPVEVTVRTVSGARFQIGPIPLVRHQSAAWPPASATLPQPSTSQTSARQRGRTAG